MSDDQRIHDETDAYHEREQAESDAKATDDSPKYPKCLEYGLKPHPVTKICHEDEYLCASYVEAFLNGHEAYKSIVSKEEYDRVCAERDELHSLFAAAAAHVMPGEFDSADAYLIEFNRTRKERDQLKAELDKLKDLGDNLPAYLHEIVRSSNDQLRAENERLRAALEKIANSSCPRETAHPQSVWWIIHVTTIAREALK